MSEVEKSNLTADESAPPIEMIKPEDNKDAITMKNIDTISEDAAASAKENVKEVPNTQAESERSIKDASNVNEHGEKEVNLESITNAVLDENNVNAIRTETQESVEEPNSSVIPPENEKTSQLICANEEKVDALMQNANDENTACISRLETKVREKTEECDSYRKKLEDTETKLAALQASYDAIMNHGDEDTLQQLRGQLVQTALMYEERNRVIANQENQINALNNQVTSLKEVVSITRDLLQIRNMEVKQLQTEVDNMEKKISEERDRHNAMISKMDSAMQLNADLKKEYETQLSLFQSLREKYGEKITLLSKEKEALEKAASASE